jgi:hypothetical protein
MKPREASGNVPKALSPLRYIKGPLKGKKAIKRRSAKREGEEVLYKLVCIEIDKEAIANKDLGCFFCGRDVEHAAHHHLKGRRGELLYEKKFIIRAHPICHYEYHFKSIADIHWWKAYLIRIHDIDIMLYNRECEKKHK